MELVIVEEGRRQLRPATRSVDKPLWNHVVASNVRHFRRVNIISQESLAADCGIFRTYLSRIETGKCNPSLLVLIALADALGILPHALFVPIE